MRTSPNYLRSEQTKLVHRHDRLGRTKARCTYYRLTHSLKWSKTITNPWQLLEINYLIKENKLGFNVRFYSLVSPNDCLLGLAGPIPSRCRRGERESELNGQRQRIYIHRRCARCVVAILANIFSISRADRQGRIDTSVALIKVASNLSTVRGRSSAYLSSSLGCLISALFGVRRAWCQSVREITAARTSRARERDKAHIAAIPSSRSARFHLFHYQHISGRAACILI